MTDQTATRAGRSLLPDMSAKGWRWVLLASLMVNVLVAGVVLGHVFGFGPPMMHQPGGPLVDYAPQRFFANVAKPRRKELTQPFRQGREDFQKFRSQSGLRAVAIADALAKQPFDGDALNALVDSYSVGPDSPAAMGAALVKDLYAKLTPEERVLLAQEIRARAGKTP
jgi:uncharacterized membrane protein